MNIILFSFIFCLHSACQQLYDRLDIQSFQELLINCEPKHFKIITLKEDTKVLNFNSNDTFNLRLNLFVNELHEYVAEVDLCIENKPLLLRIKTMEYITNDYLENSPEFKEWVSDKENLRKEIIDFKNKYVAEINALLTVISFDLHYQNSREKVISNDTEGWLNTTLKYDKEKIELNLMFEADPEIYKIKITNKIIHNSKIIGLDDKEMNFIKEKLDAAKHSYTHECKVKYNRLTNKFEDIKINFYGDTYFNENEGSITRTMMSIEEIL